MNNNLSKKNIILATILIFLFTLIYTFYIFSFIRQNEFLAHIDSPNYLSLLDIYNKSFVRILDEGGQTNLIQVSVNFLNLFFYSFLYRIGLSVRVVQFLFLFLLSFAIMFFSFLGFYKLISYYNKYKHSRQDLIDSLIITLFYCSSLFNILTMNLGQAFTLPYLIFGLLPLLFYYLLKFAQKGKINNKQLVYLALILFVAINQVTYIIPIVFAILVFCLTQYQNILKHYRKVKIQNIIYSILLPLFASSYLIFAFIFENKFNNAFKKEIFEGSQMGNLQGGFLNIFMNYSSWTLYTDWSPKSIMTFHDYYLSSYYIIAAFSIYFIIILAILRDKTLSKKSIPYLGILLVGLFFSKGSQEPAGEFFTYLLKSPIFVLVRTPDSKFTIIVIFALSSLILLVLRFYRKSKIYRYLRLYFIIIIIFISLPLLKGEVILAKDNYPNSGSAITSIPTEYQQVLNILNNDYEIFNVLVYPKFSMVVNHYDHLFIGRDILRTQTYKPFLYNTFTNFPGKSEILDLVYEDYDLKQIKKLNVKYILIRKDDYYAKPESLSIFTKYLEDEIASLVTSNDFIDLYKLNRQYYTARLFLSENNSDTEIKFVNVSPVKYIIKLENFRGKLVLNFLESYNRFFKLYLQPIGKGSFDKQINLKVFELEDLSYLYRKPVFEQGHKLLYSYANSWLIDSNIIEDNYSTKYYQINPDGSFNIELVLYFKPQSLYYWSLLVSLICMVGCVIYLAIYNILKKKNSNK